MWASRNSPVKDRSAVIGSAVFAPNCHRCFEPDYDPNADEVPPSAVPPCFLHPCCSESRRGPCRPRKAGRRPGGSGSKWACSTGLFILCAMSPRSRTRFFPQAAALSPLRSLRDTEPAQHSKGQRSHPSQRPVGARPAGVLFQSRAARRLRTDVFHFAG